MIGLMWGWIAIGAQVRPSIRKWHRERLPVRLSDLIEAVVCGRWSANYEGKTA